MHYEQPTRPLGITRLRGRVSRLGRFGLRTGLELVIFSIALEINYFVEAMLAGGYVFLVCKLRCCAATLNVFLGGAATSNLVKLFANRIRNGPVKNFTLAAIDRFTIRKPSEHAGIALTLRIVREQRLNRRYGLWCDSLEIVGTVALACLSTERHAPSRQDTCSPFQIHDSGVLPIISRVNVVI